MNITEADSPVNLSVAREVGLQEAFSMNIAFPSTIRGRKVNLRRPTRADVPDIARLAKDPDVPRFTFVPGNYTREKGYQFLKIARRGWRRRTDFVFCIVGKESDRFLGMIGLHGLNLRHRNAETGYWMGKPYRGKGYSSEGLHLLLRFCFRELKLKRVTACVFPENKASAAMLKKAGFRYEGTLRKALYHKGCYRDSLLYSILREEWR